MSRISSIPEVYPDESLSSWMYRVREAAPEPEIRVLKGMSNEERAASPLSTIYLKTVDFYGNDYDFDFNAPEVQAFVQCYGLSMDWIKCTFAAKSTQIIPIWFRSDYCLQCMEDSVKEVGFPVYLKSWRLLLKPFCDKHACVLRSADNYLHTAIDFSMDIFEFDSGRLRDLEKQAEWLERDAPLHALARMVVSRVDMLLIQTHDAVARDKMERFVLTLLRMALMSEFWADYETVLKFKVQSCERFDNIKKSALFHQLPLRVTAITRARSFYLIGLMLGWISEEQALQARPNCDFYLTTSVTTLWRRMGGLYRIRPILHLYSTEFLNISSLSGWEIFDV